MIIDHSQGFEGLPEIRQQQLTSYANGIPQKEIIGELLPDAGMSRKVLVEYFKPTVESTFGTTLPAAMAWVQTREASVPEIEGRLFDMEQLNREQVQVLSATSQGATTNQVAEILGVANYAAVTRIKAVAARLGHAGLGMPQAADMVAANGCVLEEWWYDMRKAPEVWDNLALSSLSDQTREVVRAYVGNFSYDQISASSGVRRGDVTDHVHTAVQAFDATDATHLAVKHGAAFFSRDDRLAIARTVTGLPLAWRQRFAELSKHPSTEGLPQRTVAEFHKIVEQTGVNGITSDGARKPQLIGTLGRIAETTTAWANTPGAFLAQEEGADVPGVPRSSRQLSVLRRIDRGYRTELVTFATGGDAREVIASSHRSASAALARLRVGFQGALGTDVAGPDVQRVSEYVLTRTRAQ